MTEDRRCDGINEMSRIFQVEAYDPAYGPCEWCDKIAEDEAKEKA
ncbi:MAG: hypothetical protein PW845_24800 [Pseudomonas sp.]|nr:hypothetical protein [Pseudomonas sp.]